MEEVDEVELVVQRVAALDLGKATLEACESGHVRLLVGGQLAPGWRTSNLRIGGHDLGPRHARCE